MTDKIDEIEKRINAGHKIVIEPDGTVRDMTPEEIAMREADEKRSREKVDIRNKKPILCLDFDGVIHSYSSGWQGADVISDPPVDGAIGFMLAALKHFDIVIFSSRSSQRGGLAAMQCWLRKHAGAAWYESLDGLGIEAVRFVTEKPPALVTIDDRALTFDGTWPSIESLKSFKPWNKPPPKAERKPGRSRLVYDKAKRTIVTQRLNAVGKPYGEQYDPNYRIKTPLTSIKRLRKPWIVRPLYVVEKWPFQWE
jgi:hypothetical protein